MSQKLEEAQRANEIYRSQLKYMQDHLSSLRSLIQDKESIIKNLQSRLVLSSVETAVAEERSQLNADDISLNNEKILKAFALSQRTILENFTLREMVNELRDENFHLRNEIYE